MRKTVRIPVSCPSGKKKISVPLFGTSKKATNEEKTIGKNSNTGDSEEINSPNNTKTIHYKTISQCD